MSTCTSPRGLSIVNTSPSLLIVDTDGYNIKFFQAMFTWLNLKLPEFLQEFY